MDSKTQHSQQASLLLVALLIACPMARADVVTDWNIKAGEIVVAAGLGAPPANRVMAIAQTAVYEAVNAITKRYPPSASKLDAAPGASVVAAVAAANRATLVRLIPSQQAAIETAYQAALAKPEIGNGPVPTLTTTSPTAKGAARSWKTVDDFIQEVADARIYDGVHYRNSTEVGTTMGKQVGGLAAAKYPGRAD